MPRSGVPTRRPGAPRTSPCRPSKPGRWSPRQSRPRRFWCRVAPVSCRFAAVEHVRDYVRFDDRAGSASLNPLQIGRNLALLCEHVTIAGLSGSRPGRGRGFDKLNRRLVANGQRVRQASTGAGLNDQRPQVPMLRACLYTRGLVMVLPHPARQPRDALRRRSPRGVWGAMKGETAAHRAVLGLSVHKVLRRGPQDWGWTARTR